MKEKITKDVIKEIFRRKSYNYDEKLNIIGIRRDVAEAEEFQDYIVLIYEGVMGIYEATTNPAKYWLLNPEHTQDVMVLKAGHYKNAWSITKRGDYDILSQIKPVDIWRNKEGDVIEDNGLFDADIHCINLYRNEDGDDADTSIVSQIFKHESDYHSFMNHIKKSSNERFTYTLLEESDLDEVI